MVPIHALQQWWSKSLIMVKLAPLWAGVVAFAVLLIGVAAGGTDTMNIVIVSMVAIVLCLVILAALRVAGSVLKSRNLDVDKQIHGICDQLTSTIGGAVVVEYRTIEVLQRPTGANAGPAFYRSDRYICFAKAGDAGAVQAVPATVVIGAIDQSSLPV